MTDEELRQALAERLAESGHLRTEPWREAEMMYPPALRLAVVVLLAMSTGTLPRYSILG